MLIRRARSEGGAVAVIAAICAIVLFSVAALAVDLGNAYARKRAVQNQADFAALAAGTDLTGTGGALSSNDPAVIAAADYLVKNWPQTDDGAATPSAIEMRTRLTNTSRQDGQACYGTFGPPPERACNSASEKFSVLTPESQVDFAFAEILPSGLTDVDLVATATVQVGSPGTSNVVPMYAADGCDYGRQKITQPSGGHTTGLVLADPDHENDAALTGLTPTQVPLDSGPQNLAVSGTGFIRTISPTTHNVEKVGFFEPGGGAPIVVSAVTDRTATSLNVTIPSTVTSVQSYWYVRVWQYNNATGHKRYEWTSVADAEPLLVGDALLTCAEGSSSGNFGSLILPRTDSTNSTSNGWLPRNMATGLQSPLSLHIFPGAASPADCSASTPGAVMSSGAPTADTNCVTTDPGLVENAATNGLITGVGSSLGRLNKDTSPSCTPDTRSAAFGSYLINNDTLTCFFTSSSTILGTIQSETYAGPSVLTPEIYKSPRFIWAPVFGQIPDNGKKSWKVIDFRPGFITDQPASATKATPASATNGLTYAGSKVESVSVVFFNSNALPAAVTGGVVTGPYLGVGPKIISLTD